MTVMTQPSSSTAAGLVPAVAPRFVPVIPESAPFTSAQRSWLNGFLAGLLGGGQTQASAVGGAPAAAQPAAPAEQPEEMPWHDPAMAMSERLKLVEDKAPERKLMAAMAQLDCGACGYLCQTYAEAIARGEEKDLTRCTPGGRDTSKMLKQLISTMPKSAAPAGEVKVKKPAAVQAPGEAQTWDRGNPFPARLLASKPLNGPGSAKDTRLVEIDLRESGITYRPGDALGVFPENCPNLVRDILGEMHFTGAEDVPGWDGSPISLHEALLREFTITRPTPDLMDILSRSATDETEKQRLTALRDSETLADDFHVLDLLRRFPSARPDASSFVATLSPLSPRLYSISSSQAAHPRQVHLTVGSVRFENRQGRSCGGVCSTFLADRMRPGQTLRVFVHPSHKFGLPEGEQPVIMVGPGTGIAPFRAFLQHRAATGNKGKNWLFFGDQREACDSLYASELQGFMESKVLTRVDNAFSRDSGAKVYVQHRMLEHGAELWKWLQDGAHFYVCGDAKRMALDVDAALRKLIAEHGAMPTADADAYVANLTRTNRYQRDVY